jgi:hypothetical protein
MVIVAYSYTIILLRKTIFMAYSVMYPYLWHLVISLKHILLDLS